MYAIWNEDDEETAENAEKLNEPTVSKSVSGTSPGCSDAYRKINVPKPNRAQQRLFRPHINFSSWWKSRRAVIHRGQSGVSFRRVGLSLSRLLLRAHQVLMVWLELLPSHASCFSNGSEEVQDACSSSAVGGSAALLMSWLLIDHTYESCVVSLLLAWNRFG